MDTRKDPRRLLWGIVLVALGLLFLAGNFGYGTWFIWDRWWPLLLIAIGLLLLYRQRTEVPPGSAAPPPAAGQPPVPVGGTPDDALRTPEGSVPASRPFPTAAIILIGIGVAFLLDQVIGGNAFPAFVLIAIGVALLLRQRAAS